jgi:hypothetical protein
VRLNSRPLECHKKNQEAREAWPVSAPVALAFISDMSSASGTPAEAQVEALIAAVFEANKAGLNAAYAARYLLGRHLS